MDGSTVGRAGWVDLQWMDGWMDLQYSSQRALQWMDGWIYSTLPSARTPKNQGVLFVGVPSAGGAVAGRAGRPNWALLWVHGPHGQAPSALNMTSQNILLRFRSFGSDNSTQVT